MGEGSYAEAVAEQDVISQLLDKSFAARTVCEQGDILQHKKPLPRLRVRTGNRIFQGGCRMVCQKGMALSFHIILCCVY